MDTSVAWVPIASVTELSGLVLHEWTLVLGAHCMCEWADWTRFYTYVWLKPVSQGFDLI